MQRTALTPEQKRYKKDYLFEQARRNAKPIPSWEEVWPMVQSDPSGDGYGHTEEWILDDNEEEIEETAWDMLVDEQDIDAADPSELTAEQEARYNALREEALDALMEAHYHKRYERVVHEVERLGGMEVYRLVSLPPTVHPATLQGLGRFWSLDPEKVGLYGMGAEDVIEKNRNWRFAARVDLRNVDLYGTVMAQMDPTYGEEEEEVLFFPHAPIRVYDAQEILDYDRGSGPSLELAGYREGDVVNIDAYRRV